MRALVVQSVSSYRVNGLVYCLHDAESKRYIGSIAQIDLAYAKTTRGRFYTVIQGCVVWFSTFQQAWNYLRVAPCPRY